MCIERNLLKQTARLFGALACAVVLAACISPDLEPPGAADTNLPAHPGGTERGADEEARKKAREPAADAGAIGTTDPSGAKPAITPGNNTAAAGQGAQPAMGAMTMRTPPPSVPGDPNPDADADAGTGTP